jgi:hypothetical protein
MEHLEHYLNFKTQMKIMESLCFVLLIFSKDSNGFKKFKKWRTFQAPRARKMGKGLAAFYQLMWLRSL